MASFKKNTRMCIACRQHADKSELARFVLTADGVVSDESGKMDGRGVWLHKNAECIAKTKKKRLLSAYFHQNVSDDVLRGLDEG